MSDTIIEIAQCAANLKKLVLHTEVSLDTVQQILRFRPTLEHAEFRLVFGDASSPDWRGPFPNLQTLILLRHRASAMDLWPLGKLLEQRPRLTPSLQSLTLSRWQGYPSRLSDLPLTHLSLEDNFMVSFPMLPSTMEYLHLKPNKPFYLSSGPFQVILQNQENPWVCAEQCHLPNLTCLGFAGFQDVNAAFLSALLDRYATDEQVIELIADYTNVKSLEHLSITDCTFQSSSGRLFGSDGVFTTSPRLLSRSLKSLYV
jgi:F-box/TPR repeat protein Pof3